ncbi:hypothetical protein H5410_056908 [Solanum commersonii]|uniref:Uncharacterized protein n=1 Tax=Solanum commersonii TaxID=4109 RepID=A0A9J5WPE4_SOLCO|nr:hypothetical protein H5410_056908 [Solanum commersonii]
MKGLVGTSPNSSACSTILPNGLECEDAEGKDETTMKQNKGESPSQSAASTNFTERFASAIL